MGTVLGPLLFLICINDLRNNKSSNLRLLAGDCVLYRQIITQDDHLTLQRDLETINDWCVNSLLLLSVTKCKVLSSSRKRSFSHHTYSLGTSPISSATSYKYVGVHFTANLYWALHISTVTANASRMLGSLKRHLKPTPSRLRKLAYETHVRPKLEYA